MSLSPAPFWAYSRRMSDTERLTSDRPRSARPLALWLLGPLLRPAR